TLCLLFFNAPPPTYIYTLSLHDALPICWKVKLSRVGSKSTTGGRSQAWSFSEFVCFSSEISWLSFSSTSDSNALLGWLDPSFGRSEEHTSELQSQSNLVCRLLLEKKNKR